MRRVLKQFLPWLVVLCVALAFLPVSVASDNGITVSIYAPPEVDEGSGFVAAVNITEVTNFKACQFDVTYNPAIIQVIGAEGGTGVTSGMLDGTAVLIDNWGFIPPGTPGTMRILGNLPLGANVTGSGYLAEIHFNVVGSPCNTSELTLSNGYLFDYEGIEIPVAEWLGASVHVAGIPTPPTIALGPSSFSFSAIEGGANPADKTLHIWNSGGGLLDWTASDDAFWLGLAPTTGTSAGTHDRNPVTVSVDTWAMAAGSYGATITISDPLATNDPRTVDVSLEISAPGALNADFTATPRTGLAPATVGFSDKTTGGVEPYSYVWDFGDGATSTAENPSHTYVAIGTFTVALTVTDDVADTDSETKQAYITVAEIAPAGEPKFSVSNLHISPQQAQPNQPVEISVNIANVGGATGSYNAALYVNGQLENSNTVGVAPGSTQAVVFTVTRADVGTYDVSFAGLQAQFTVVQPSGGGLGTGGIIAIVVVVIVLILALIFVVPGIRKRE